MTKNGTTNGNDISNYVFGKVQPQAIPLEEAVLGAMMLDREAVGAISEILRPDDFYLDAHKHIYRAILSLHGRSMPVDMLTVTEELKKAGKIEDIGGSYYIVELTGRIASSANIEYHARIVVQKSIERKLIEVSSKTIKEAYEGAKDTFALLEEAEKAIFGIYDGIKTHSSESISRAATQALGTVIKAMNAPDGVTGVTSGIRRLDRITGGWQDTDLIIIAARPGMGKTGLALTLAKNAAIAKIPVAIFSLEMSSEQLAHRIISSVSAIEGMKSRNGKITNDELGKYEEACIAVSELPIFICDKAGLSIFQIQSEARRMVSQNKAGLIIVDYLQLAKDPECKGNREQEISSIARGLKALAKDLKVPVIALAQLSRAVEVRGGSKRPQLSDLRESGSIEQEADVVSFIYRPEYYQILEDENGQSLKGVAEIIFAKNRHGRIGTEVIEFIEKTTEFVDPDEFAKIANQNPIAPSAGLGSMFGNLKTPEISRNDDDIPF